MAFPSLRAKLYLAAWLETHTEFRLPGHSKNLSTALTALEQPPLDQSRKSTNYLQQFCQLKRYFNRGIVALLLICFTLGLVAVPPAFAINQANQVNFFWLLIVLLGLHSLNLILWLITLIATAFYTGGGKGILLSTLIFINQKVGKHSRIQSEVSQAYLHWQCHPTTNKWLISTLSHGAWGCYLLAGWLMTLLLLLTKQVNFVWETTLLSEQAFLRLTNTLSLLPNGLGVTTPTPLDILASRVDLVIQSPSTRQHWANFLLASLMLYGVLPRLVLTLCCLAMYRFKRISQAMSTQEKIIQNRYQDQASQHSRIIDHDRYATNNTVNHSVTALPVLNAQALQQNWALFEWSTKVPAYLQSASSKTIINTSDQQTHFLTATSPDPIYILVDGKQSPDRGTRRFFSQAKAAYPLVCMVISEGEKATFVEDWQRLGQATAVPSFQVRTEE